MMANNVTDDGIQRGAAKVAVIIVNYNCGKLLERCLQSLRKQTFASFRTIVVDNDSKDGSADDIESSHSGVEVIRLHHNAGFAAGNNIGAAAATSCEWIACLNPDAFPAEDWLENLMVATEKNPEYAFFGSYMLQAEDPSMLDGTGDIYHVSGMAWRRDHRKPATQGSQSSGEIFAPCAAAALYRSDAFNEVGGFDESFFCYFEDVDLAFRLRLRGHKCLYVRDAVVSHMGSAITGYQSDFTIYHGHRNLVWTYFKDMPAPLLLIYLPQHILLNIVSLLVYSFRGKFRVIVKAKWHAILGLPRIFRLRRTIQQSKLASAADIRRVMAKGFLSHYRRR